MQTARSLHSFRTALLATLLVTPVALQAQAPTNGEAGKGWQPQPAVPASTAAPATTPLGPRNSLTFGYFPNARPLSFRDDAGNADGYAVALCRGVAAVARMELKRPALQASFVPVGADAMEQLRSGRIDVLCAPVEATLARRADASFSLPVFRGGTGILMRRDANAELRKVLEGRTPESQPVWRGSPVVPVLNQRRFVVVAGSSSERWATARKEELKVNSILIPVPDLATGLEKVRSGEADGFLSDRSVLLDLARKDDDVVVLNSVYNHVPMALAMRRGDEDLRLLVDLTLSRLYRTGRIDGVYAKWFGKPDSATRAWFQETAEPE